jgi:hypothetical protein
MQPEPQRSIDWFYEGYRAILLYHREDVPVKRFEALCRDIARASGTAETIADRLRTSWSASIRGAIRSVSACSRKRRPSEG